MKRLALAAFAAAVLAVLAGCGGESTLSGTQLQAQATSICALASSRASRIPTPSSPDGSAAFLRAGIAALTPELTGLRALRPPDDVASVYTATVGSFAQKLRDMQGAVQDLDRGDDPVSTMQDLQRKLGPLESDENGGWQALQLPACLSR
jgi:hypothetical protein